jgi:hypothetical protein
MPAVHAVRCACPVRLTAAGAQPEQCGYVVEFEEPSGANPMVEMLMQGMAASADASVKQTLRGD